MSDEMELHRIKDVMATQPIKIGGLAKRLEIPLEHCERIVEPTADIFLSTLYKVQQAFNCPILELLIDDYEPVKSPIRERVGLLRLMKYVGELIELEPTESQGIVLSNMRGELIAMMPELKSVSPWPKIGHRIGKEDHSMRDENQIDAEELGMSEEWQQRF